MRPTEFRQHIADQICEQLADGKSLRAICAGDDMPNRSTVFRWLAHADHVEFRDQYARAREAQADLLAEEVVELADQVLEGKTVVEKEVAVACGNNGGSELQPTTETRTCDAVDRSRLMVDARKWFASKLAPKKYGNKIEHSGAIGIHEAALDELE